MTATATPQIQRIFNNARVKLPGAIDDMLKLELYNVLFEFFTDSNIWQDVLSVPVTTATATYYIDPTDNAQFTRLMSVLTSTLQGNVNVNATMQVPGILVLQYTPTVADTLSVTVAKTIIDPVTVVPAGTSVTDPLVYGFPNYPTWVVDKYITGVVDGLVGRMMSQTAKPYSDKQMAVYHLRKFKDTVTTARNEVNRLNVYGAQRWNYPQGFAARRKGVNASFTP